jgi:methionyl-tRNA formyltransferase
MGTPDFAVPSLERLVADGHDIPLVLTQPDKPRNRGMKLDKSPVKLFAEKRIPNAAVFQPTSLRDPDAIARIRDAAPELIIVVAYGKLLPPEILELPKLGCVNIHGSLLPKYRGAAPIQRAVLAGERVTGVTSMYMAQALDAGDIIFKRETEIGERETSGELFTRLAQIGADVLSDTVAAIARGDAPRAPQIDDDASYAPPILREESPIDWRRTVSEILNHIRGMNPKPCATAQIINSTARISGEIFKIHAAEPGRASGITVQCSDGEITITELQAPGGRRMSATDYLRGHPDARVIT